MWLDGTCDRGSSSGSVDVALDDVSRRQRTSVGVWGSVLVALCFGEAHVVVIVLTGGGVVVVV